jgi:hypothetical protein
MKKYNQFKLSLSFNLLHLFMIIIIVYNNNNHNNNIITYFYKY